MEARERTNRLSSGSRAKVVRRQAAWEAKASLAKLERALTRWVCGWEGWGGRVRDVVGSAVAR